MTHDFEFENYIIYFENPWLKQIDINMVTDENDNVLELSEREMERLQKETRKHCEYNDWFDQFKMDDGFKMLDDDNEPI